jgi:hypothetical protein
MTKPLPKWVMMSYAKLWQSFKDKAFDHHQATGILKENTSVIISHLKRNGWIDITLNQQDSRKREYRLKSPENAVAEMANIDTKQNKMKR